MATTTQLPRRLASEFTDGPLEPPARLRAVFDRLFEADGTPTEAGKKAAKGTTINQDRAFPRKRPCLPRTGAR